LIKLNFRRGEVTSQTWGRLRGVDIREGFPRFLVALELWWEKVPRPLRERQSEFFGSGLDLPRSRFSAGVWRNLLHCPCRKRAQSFGRLNRRKSWFVRLSREIRLNDK